MYEEIFSIFADSKVKGCLNCHGSSKDNDYVFTDNMVKYKPLEIR